MLWSPSHEIRSLERSNITICVESLQWEPKIALQKKYHTYLIIANDESTLWKVPISITYPMKEGPLITTAKVWLTEKESNFKAEQRPYIINVKESGYYRYLSNIHTLL